MLQPMLLLALAHVVAVGGLAPIVVAGHRYSYVASAGVYKIDKPLDTMPTWYDPDNQEKLYDARGWGVFDTDDNDRPFELEAKQYVPAVVAPSAELQVSPLGYNISAHGAAWLADRRAALVPEVARVVLEGGTERPFSSAYASLKEAAAGQETVYASAVGGQPVFASDAMFESGTGWPSFTHPVDASHVAIRAEGEVVCARSGAHLGHVFSDGPPPRGKRWCINAAALTAIDDAPVPLEARPVTRGCDGGPAMEALRARVELETDEVWFGLGCYWRAEELLAAVPGVLSTQCGLLREAEVVSVRYDRRAVSLVALLQLFFAAHDTTALRAVGERGPGGRYRSLIAVPGAAEEAAAADVVAAVRRELGRPVVVEVEIVDRGTWSEAAAADQMKRGMPAVREVAALVGDAFLGWNQ